MACPTEAANSKIDLPAGESAASPAYLYPEPGLWPETALPEDSVAYMQKISATSTVEPTEYITLKGEATGTAKSAGDPEIDDNLPPLENELRQQYFGQAPDNYLIDPQQLITEQKANDVVKFLELHADKSEFEIYPIVIGRHQTIPEDVDLQQLHKDWFGDKPVLLFVYTVRAPDSLKIICNQNVVSRLPAPALAKIRENCINKAKLSDNGPDQLEKIANELSVQAFWLEMLIKRSPNPPEKGTNAVPLKNPVDFEKIATAIRKRLSETAPVKWLVIACSAILLLAFVLIVKGIVSRRAGAGKNPILFPSYTRIERLGGEFSGGNFVGISFETGRSKR